jgi:hypothetical protein
MGPQANIQPEACFSLKVAVPIFRLHSQPNDPNFFRGAAFFNSKAPLVLRPENGVGCVDYIYSRKKARESIARNVLKILEELHQQQMEE